MTLKNTVAVTFATLALSVTPALVAPAMAQESQPATEVPDTELDAFVVAYKDVVAIEQSYSDEFEAAASEEEQQSIVNQAQIEMTQAIEDAPNIGVDRYVEILQMAQTDPELQQELGSRLGN